MSTNTQQKGWNHRQREMMQNVKKKKKERRQKKKNSKGDLELFEMSARNSTSWSVKRQAEKKASRLAIGYSNEKRAIGY